MRVVCALAPCRSAEIGIDSRVDRGTLAAIVNQACNQIGFDHPRTSPQGWEAAWLGNKDAYFTNVHGIKRSLVGMSRADRL